MAETVKIAITGGPCAGKTTAIGYLKNELLKRNIGVYTVEEQATRLLREGKSPLKTGVYEFHKELFEHTLDLELAAEELAKKDGHLNAVILCDRGLLDSRAYVFEDDFKKYSSLFGLNEDLIRNRYDAVFHMVTAADGAEEFYGSSSNNVRYENARQAIEVDRKTLSVWVGAEHLRIIDNSTDFDAKLLRLLDEVLAVLGIPQPLEIEKKLLIKRPDPDFLNSLDLCRKVPITQAYLSTPNEGRFRVRKRGGENCALYIRTVKIKLTDMKRIEKEEYISREQYKKYMSDREHITGIISKDRYCIAYNSCYFELDIYPFWNDKATLEIELLSEEQPFELPPFIEVIRDVTSDRSYSNLVLAQKYCKI